MTVLQGTLVRLRPLERADLDEVLSVAMQFETEGRTWAQVRENLRERIKTSDQMTERELLLGIEAGGRLVGDIQAFRGGTPKGVFDIGIALFDVADRRKGYGSDAIAVFTAHLFDERGAHRVQLSTDVANAGMRSVAERLGFREEGILRGFWPGPDGPRDYISFAMTRSDYEERRLI